MNIKPVKALFLIFVFLVINMNRVEAASPYTYVGAGYLHSCALNSAGEVFCWGDNEVGQLGQGTITNVELLPQKVQFPSAVTSLSVGPTHNCAISSGQTYCWGQNYQGKLGSGDNENQLKPNLVKGLPAAKQVIAGRTASCAVSTDGSAFCWGDNSKGILGNGSKETSLTPVQVKGLMNIKQISLGSFHACALTQDGKTYCWGDNASLQLGQANLTESLLPIEVPSIPQATAVASGSGHSCILSTNKSVTCWGYGARGQIGNGKNEDASLPSNVILPNQVLSIQTGRLHTCVLLESKEINCWGASDVGQVGYGKTVDVNVPQVVISKSKFGILGGLSSYSSHTCALLENGSLSCWGLGEAGQLGNGDKNSLSAPLGNAASTPTKATSDVDLSVSIKCKKGNEVKTITALAPKCPTGYTEIRELKPRPIFYLDAKVGCYSQNYPVTSQVVFSGPNYKTLYPASCTGRFHYQVIFSGAIKSNTGTGIPTKDEVKAVCANRFIVSTGQPAPTTVSPGATYIYWFFPDAGVEAKKFPNKVVCMLMKTDNSYSYVLAQSKPLGK